MVELYPFFIYFGLFHCCLYFFDTFFKTCLHLPYLNLLKNCGIQVKLFRILWHTTAFNRILQKWGSTRPKLLLTWFSVGSWMTIIFIPLAILILIRSSYLIVKNIFIEGKSDVINIGTLQPMVPGINLPLSEVFYYFSALFICTIVHELGHAVAAVREDGRVSGVGVVLGFCVPVAYVSLENVECLPMTRQLRIFCAGVWHNVLLALITASLSITLPWLLLPLYDWGNGVQVQSIQQDSPLFGVGGLKIRDMVVEINKCVVEDVTSWQNCLVQSVRLPTPGYCLHSEFIKEHDESMPAKHLSSGVVECCSTKALSHLCFEHLEKDDEPLNFRQYSCLNVRTVSEHVNHLCYKPQDCKDNLFCFLPSLENSTKLLSIKTNIGKAVLFLGHPAEVYHTVHVSNYRDLYSVFPSSIPEKINLFCQYITSFSVGMAILNIIPCFYFDGQHIIRTLTDIYFTRHIEYPSVRHAISICLTFFGTCTLSVYIVVAFWSSVK